MHWCWLCLHPSVHLIPNTLTWGILYFYFSEPLQSMWSNILRSFGMGYLGILFYKFSGVWLPDHFPDAIQILSWWNSTQKSDSPILMAVQTHFVLGRWGGTLPDSVIWSLWSFLIPFDFVVKSNNCPCATKTFTSGGVIPSTPSLIFLFTVNTFTFLFLRLTNCSTYECL